MTTREAQEIIMSHFLSNHRSIYHTLTSGYDPQANGTAERSVGLMKALSSRCLTASGLSQEFWSYAVRYAAQSLLCSSLQRKQKSPPFGSSVIAKVLGHKDVKYPEPRSISGRLLYWDHLQDQLSYILCSPDDNSQEYLVYRAGMPALSPPEMPEPKGTFDKPLKNDAPADPVDLDEDDDGFIHLDHLEGTSFTYFYLSSEESPQALTAEKDNDLDDDILIQEASPPTSQPKDLQDEDAKKKQATTHISVSPDVVLASKGQEREKWLTASRKEIDNLTLPKAITAISPQEKSMLKDMARLKGEDYIELPAKVVFTIKPEKYKVRIVACGNQTQDTYGKITTTDLDTCMLRFLLSWAASTRSNTIASLDVTAAFLNADLPPGRIVVLRPPTILYKLGLIPTGFVWRVHRAVYGLRQAPSLWSQERTKVMEKMNFRCRGESFRVLISEIHRSILLLVREQDIIDKPQTLDTGLTQGVQPRMSWPFAASM